MGWAIPRKCDWCPDIADYRDFVLGHSKVTSMLRGLKSSRPGRFHLPQHVDWREYCGDVDVKEGLATSASHACLAAIQQMERRSSGRHVQMSGLFVDFVAKRMERHSNQTKASLRTIMKAIVQCGVPPEKYWPHDDSTREREPDAFVFSFQKSYRALRYVRLDDRRASGPELLQRLQAFITAGFSIAFGFPVHTSMSDDAEIAYPDRTDSIVGGQAVTAVGFDNRVRIRSDKGALLIRNCMGATWGNNGYGWLPYTYVTERLAADFWTAIKPSWLRSGEFERPYLPD